MTNETLIKLILDELKAELSTETDLNEDLLRVKIQSAIREVKTARRYPASYSESLIENDLERYISQIKSLALFDYNQIGAEGQASYSADGENIQYIDRNTLFAGVLPVGVVR